VLQDLALQCQLNKMVEEKNKETKDVKEKIEKEVAKAEKELAKEVTKIEDQVEKHKITQKKATKEITEEVKEVVKETKEDIKEIKEETKNAEKEIKDNAKEENKKVEEIKDIKKETKKAKKIPSKSEAVVNGKDLPISNKHAIAICNFIRGKTIDEAAFLLSQVLQMKRAVPMKGEIPHRKGKMMSGRYPINATKVFIKLLRQLTANATVNGIEIEKVRIECKADRANRPYRRFGSKKFKRCHVTFKVSAKKQNKLKKKK